MTITAKQAQEAFGDPTKETHMRLFNVPKELRVGAIPARIYCNVRMIPVLTAAFQNIKNRGLAQQVVTWDGCFQIRKQRGSFFTASLHSWGLAIDINASWNKLGAKPTMTAELVACFTDAGMEWGGNWRRPDGMHFQLAKL